MTQGQTGDCMLILFTGSARAEVGGACSLPARTRDTACLLNTSYTAALRPSMRAPLCSFSTWALLAVPAGVVVRQGYARGDYFGELALLKEQCVATPPPPPAGPGAGCLQAQLTPSRCACSLARLLAAGFAGAGRRPSVRWARSAAAWWGARAFGACWR